MPWNTWFLSSYLKDKKILTGYGLALSIKLLRSRKKKKKPYIIDYYCKPLPFWQTEEEKAVLGQGGKEQKGRPISCCILASACMVQEHLCWCTAPISSSGIFHTSVLESECIFLQRGITTYVIFLLYIQWSMYFCSSAFHHHHLI